MTPRAATPLEPAPASPRVAEELVEKCAEAACSASGGIWAFCDSKAEWRAAASAIITLAQDAKLREVAAVLDAKLAEFDGSFYDPADGSMGMLQWAVDQVRAMMVMP